MGDSDESLLTFAKLREQAAGNLDGSDHLLRHGGLSLSEAETSALTFLDQSVRHGDVDASGLEGTRAGRALLEDAVTGEASRSVREGDADAASHLVGVTEQELDGSSLRLAARVLAELTRPEPVFAMFCGNPDTGKTNAVSLCTELWRYDVRNRRSRPAPLVISNVEEWELTDVCVRSMHELMETIVKHRDRPKFVFVDEGSTHFDARRYRSEVGNQWSPAAKRFAKLGVEVVATVSHTEKDVHPEFKRLVNLAVRKHTQKAATFFGSWRTENGDCPTEPLFSGPVRDLEPTGAEYDPEDTGPWSWNLRGDLVAEAETWPDLQALLESEGPAPTSA